MRIQSFGPSSVEMWREFPDHQAPEFTNDECCDPLLESCIQATNA
jgi:hypothetical protein